MPYMPLVRCPKCGVEFSAMKYKCPSCGKRRTMENDSEFAIPDPVLSTHKDEEMPAAVSPAAFQKNRKIQTILGASLIAVSIFTGTLSVVSLQARRTRIEVTPEPVVTAIPTPSPTPTPTINSIRLYDCGQELTDGFTAYIGDDPLTLSVELDPAVTRPSVSWSMGDRSVASLSVSSDGLSCEFYALKPSGKNELVVRCYGAELTVPVFLWER